MKRLISKIILNEKILMRKIANKSGGLNKLENQLTFVQFLIGSGMISMKREIF